MSPESLRHIVFRGDHPGSSHAGRVAAGQATPAEVRMKPEAEPLDPDLARLYRHLFELSSLDATRYRATVLRRREAACLRALRAKDARDAEAQLLSDPQAAARALRAVVIGVTSFFRDPRAFEGLTTPIGELSGARPEGINVLSVGCSDGSELYSVAILLDQLGIFAQSLFGIDCRLEAVHAAESGVYPATALAEVPADLVARYFEMEQGKGVPPDGPGRDAATVRASNASRHSPSNPVSTPSDLAGRPARMRVRAELRQRCRWARADAFDLPESPSYDLILCRNVLIYLTPEAASELWSLLVGRLEPGGLLFVGKAERPSDELGLRRVGPFLYHKRG
jgi:chemotaxis methyl-accepting protein methylase